MLPQYYIECSNQKNYFIGIRIVGNSPNTTKTGEQKEDRKKYFHKQKNRKKRCCISMPFK